MAQFDTSMYRNTTVPDIAGNFIKGASLRELLDNKQKKRAVEGIFKENMQAAPDGTFSFNQDRALSQLATVDPESYVKFKKIKDEQEQARQSSLMNRAKLGLRPVMDEKGNVVRFEQDPSFKDPYANINAALKLGQIQELQGKGFLREDLTRAQLQKQLAEIERTKAQTENYRKGPSALDLDIKKADLEKRREETRRIRAERIRKGKSSGANIYQIPGLIYDGKTQLSQTDLRKAREAITQITPLITNIKNAQEMIKNSTRADWVDPSFRKTVSGYLKDAQLTYKSPEFANLGVLTGPDEKVLDAVIIDPFSPSGIYMGTDDVAKEYDKFLEKMRVRTKAFLAAYGYTPKESLLSGDFKGNKPNLKEDRKRKNNTKVRKEGESISDFLKRTGG